MDEVPTPKINPKRAYANDTETLPQPWTPGGWWLGQTLQAGGGSGFLGGEQLMSSADCGTMQPSSITVILHLLETRGAAVVPLPTATPAGKCRAPFKPRSADPTVGKASEAQDIIVGGSREILRTQNPEARLPSTSQNPGAGEQFGKPTGLIGAK